MQILCIKTDDKKKKKVLKHKYYYSKEKSVKDFEGLLIIGESYGRGTVPLLAECESAIVSKFESVQPAFYSTKNKDWVFEWKLAVNKVYPPRTNILSYIKPGTPSYLKIINCKTMCYINLNDFKSPLPKFSEASYECLDSEDGII